MIRWSLESLDEEYEVDLQIIWNETHWQQKGEYSNLNGTSIPVHFTQVFETEVLQWILYRFIHFTFKFHNIMIFTVGLYCSNVHYKYDALLL